MPNRPHSRRVVDNTNRMQDVVEGCTTRSEVLLNLISAGRLDDEGYTGSIRNGAMKFNKGSLIVARTRMVNTLYLMNARLCPKEVNVASDTTGELWHKRLCHMSVKGMKRLADDNLIPVKDCLAGKQTGPPSDQEHR